MDQPQPYHKKLDLQEIDQHRRRQRVERMLLRGMTNREDMAIAFNVDVKTIDRDVDAIKARWRDAAAPGIVEAITARIAAIDHIRVLALNGYDTSLQKKIETSVQVRVCDQRGCVDGIITDQREKRQRVCPRCGGEGYITTETRKETGKPGDAVFLKVALQCLVEAARIEGCYPGTTSAMQRVVEQSRISGEIREQVTVLYAEAPYENVIRAKALLDDLRVKNTIEVVAEQAGGENGDGPGTGVRPPLGDGSPPTDGG